MENTNEKQKSTSLLWRVKPNQVDPIMTIMEKFRKCENKDKINLTVGAYRDENLNTYVFDVVRKAEADILNLKSKNRSYLSPTGDEEFNTECRRLLFSDDSEIVKNNRLVSSQTLSGTGSLRLCAEFISNYLRPKSKVIYIPEPTWSNHDLIFKDSGYEIREFEYFSLKTLSISFDNIVKTLEQANEGDNVLLHTCAYNPTGCDLSKEQWIKVLNIVEEKKLFAILDTAYQGFATGDLVEDSYPIRLFAERKVEFAICQSFSKNLGMYGERAGALHIVFNDLGSSEKNENLGKRIKHGLFETALSMHLVPMGHGSEVIKRVLKDYYSEWQKELKEVVNRLIRMRTLLYEELVKNGCPGNWDHIIQQRGMFAYTGLTSEQCDYLIDKKNLFLVKTGRISICGINQKNVSTVAEYIKEAIEKVPKIN